jgi:hypothetical protein
MPTVKLTTMPAIEVPPTDATILVQGDSEQPLLRGKGSIDLLCGGCENVLVSQIQDGQVANLFIRCGRCSATNVVP